MPPISTNLYAHNRGQFNLEFRFSKQLPFWPTLKPPKCWMEIKRKDREEGDFVVGTHVGTLTVHTRRQNLFTPDVIAFALPYGDALSLSQLGSEVEVLEDDDPARHIFGYGMVSSKVAGGSKMFFQGFAEAVDVEIFIYDSDSCYNPDLRRLFHEKGILGEVTTAGLGKVVDGFVRLLDQSLARLREEELDDEEDSAPSGELDNNDQPSLTEQNTDARNLIFTATQACSSLVDLTTCDPAKPVRRNVGPGKLPGVAPRCSREILTTFLRRTEKTGPLFPPGLTIPPIEKACGPPSTRRHLKEGKDEPVGPCTPLDPLPADPMSLFADAQVQTVLAPVATTPLTVGAASPALVIASAKEKEGQPGKSQMLTPAPSHTDPTLPPLVPSRLPACKPCANSSVEPDPKSPVAVTTAAKRKGRSLEKHSPLLSTHPDLSSPPDRDETSLRKRKSYGHEGQTTELFGGPSDEGVKKNRTEASPLDDKSRPAPRPRDDYALAKGRERAGLPPIPTSDTYYGEGYLWKRHDVRRANLERRAIEEASLPAKPTALSQKEHQGKAVSNHWRVRTPEMMLTPCYDSDLVARVLDPGRSSAPPDTRKGSEPLLSCVPEPMTPFNSPTNILHGSVSDRLGRIGSGEPLESRDKRHRDFGEATRPENVARAIEIAKKNAATTQPTNQEGNLRTVSTYADVARRRSTYPSPPQANHGAITSTNTIPLPFERTSLPSLPTRPSGLSSTRPCAADFYGQAALHPSAPSTSPMPTYLETLPHSTTTAAGFTELVRSGDGASRSEEEREDSERGRSRGKSTDSTTDKQLRDGAVMSNPHVVGREKRNLRQHYSWGETRDDARFFFVELEHGYEMPSHGGDRKRRDAERRAAADYDAYRRRQYGIEPSLSSIDGGIENDWVETMDLGEAPMDLESPGELDTCDSLEDRLLTKSRRQEKREASLRRSKHERALKLWLSYDKRIQDWRWEARKKQVSEFEGEQI